MPILPQIDLKRHTGKETKMIYICCKKLWSIRKFLISESINCAFEGR